MHVNHRAPRRFRRRALLRALLLGGAAVPLAGAAIRRRGGQPANAQGAGDERVFVPGIAADGPVPAISLREKIGQMVVAGFRGLSIAPGDRIASDIVDRSLGGVVLYDYDVPGSSATRNIQSPAQLQALTGQLQGLSPANLLIAVDQEGGAVARLSPEHGFPPTQSAAELGAIDDPKVTYDAAAAMAETLAAAGINVNFAPVVDLNVNPENPIIGALGRSFSADPDVVTRNAEAFIRGHHDHGILCTLKHFPGHGSSMTDSHKGFVDVTDTWSQVELEPFRRIIADGLADLVMTAHIYNQHLDPDYPATLSHATVTGILRDQLGYSGVVISDDMQMKAITDEYGFEFAIQKAVEAGVDILLFGNNGDVYDESAAERAIDLLVSLVQQGTIAEARIDQSYARITALLQRL